MSKIPPKPNSKLDQWVDNRHMSESSTKDSDTLEQDEKMKRLTIDVPESLHRKLKLKSVSEGVTMADMVRQWIENSLQ